MTRAHVCLDSTGQRHRGAIERAQALLADGPATVRQLAQRAGVSYQVMHVVVVLLATDGTAEFAGLAERVTPRGPRPALYRLKGATTC